MFSYLLIVATVCFGHLRVFSRLMCVYIISCILWKVCPSIRKWFTMTLIVIVTAGLLLPLSLLLFLFLHRRNPLYIRTLRWIIFLLNFLINPYSIQSTLIYLLHNVPYTCFGFNIISDLARDLLLLHVSYVFVMGSSSSLHHICLFLFPGLSIGAIFDSSLPNPQDEPSGGLSSSYTFLLILIPYNQP